MGDDYAGGRAAQAEPGLEAGFPGLDVDLLFHYAPVCPDVFSQGRTMCPPNFRAHTRMRPYIKSLLIHLVRYISAARGR